MTATNDKVTKQTRRMTRRKKTKANRHNVKGKLSYYFWSVQYWALDRQIFFSFSFSVRSISLRYANRFFTFIPFTFSCFSSCVFRFFFVAGVMILLLTVDMVSSTLSHLSIPFTTIITFFCGSRCFYHVLVNSLIDSYCSRNHCTQTHTVPWSSRYTFLMSWSFFCLLSYFLSIGSSGKYGKLPLWVCHHFYMTETL